MDNNDIIATIAADLATVAAKNTASIVFDRIKKAKSNKGLKEQNAELQNIIQDLLNDKSELLRIAKAYEEELIAQKITDEDISYITNNLIPILKSFIPNNKKGLVEQLERVFSKETLTILQLIGFSYKRAIGEPLTQYVRSTIENKITPPPANKQADRIGVMQSMIELSKDAESYARFKNLVSLDGNPSSQEDINE